MDKLINKITKVLPTIVAFVIVILCLVVTVVSVNCMWATC